MICGNEGEHPECEQIEVDDWNESFGLVPLCPVCCGIGERRYRNGMRESAHVCWACHGSGYARVEVTRGDINGKYLSTDSRPDIP